MSFSSDCGMFVRVYCTSKIGTDVLQTKNADFALGAPEGSSNSLTLRFHNAYLHSDEFSKPLVSAPAAVSRCCLLPPS